MRTIWSVVAAVLVVIGAGVGIESGVRGPVPPAAGVNAQPGVVAGPGQQSAAQVRAQLAAALAEWSSFPVNASPRPIVLVGPTVLVGGFTTGAEKLAFLAGAIDPPRTLPRGPATAVGYPVVSARAALRSLFTGGVDNPASTRLSVERVQFGGAHFTVDRETSYLPAWMFWLTGSFGPVTVLAVAPSAIYTPPATRIAAGAQVGGLIGKSGRSLALLFYGGPPGTGPCSVDYTVSLASSATAVAVDVVAHPHPLKGADVLCPAVAVSRYVKIVLPASLGNRVLVDAASGAAINVRVAGQLYLLGS